MNAQPSPALLTKRANTVKNAYWYAGALVHVLIDGAQTNGRYAQLELTVHPGSEPPVHTHTREEEAFYMLQGAIRFTVGEHVFTAKAGEYVVLPKGIPHTFQVLTETAKAVLTISPAGFEDYFRHPNVSRPVATLELPPAPKEPRSIESIQTMVKLLDQEFGVKM